MFIRAEESKGRNSLLVRRRNLTKSGLFMREGSFVALDCIVDLHRIVATVCLASSDNVGNANCKDQTGQSCSDNNWN